MLIYSQELAKAALAHAKELGNATTCAHVGGDGRGPTSRVSKELKWSKVVAECIELGSNSASDIIASLIIDDGNEERSNRKVLFSKTLKYVGVGCAPHPEYGIVTVLNFIGGLHQTETPQGQTPEDF